jgi:hypothetical protein
MKNEEIRIPRFLLQNYITGRRFDGYGFIVAPHGRICSGARNNFSVFWRIGHGDADALERLSFSSFFDLAHIDCIHERE